MTAFEVRVRGVNLTVLELTAEIVRAKAVSSVMALSKAMAAIPKGVTLLDVVAGLATPVAHFAIVFAPGMYGAVVNGNLSSVSSFAFKVGGFVHIAVNATTDTSDGVGGGKAF